MKSRPEYADLSSSIQRKASALGNRLVPPRHGPSPIIQRQPNQTGMPDQLKSGLEQMSGLDMSDVRVIRNSSKPASLQAHAYTQGTDIHIGPGQEKHLPHEAWHVVQQKQGRVQPTMQFNGANINDDRGLEREADVMGGKAVQMKASVQPLLSNAPAAVSTIQRFPKKLSLDVAGGNISGRELLLLLQQATDRHLAQTPRAQLPEAGRLNPGAGEAGWLQNWQEIERRYQTARAGQADAQAWQQERHTVVPISVGGHEQKVTSDSRYVFPDRAGEGDFSYPGIAFRMGEGTRTQERERSQRIRSMLRGEERPGISEDEAALTSAVFGVEAMRNPRSFLSHMMLLDRIESGQSYGADGGKTLSWKKALVGNRVENMPSDDANHLAKHKLTQGRGQAGKWFGPTDYAQVADSIELTKPQTKPGELISGGHHGGKAPWSIKDSQRLGSKPLPAEGNKPNLVQAKEIANLIHWLELQELDTAQPPEAVEARIRELLVARLGSMDFMGASSARIREDMHKARSYDFQRGSDLKK